MKIRGWPIHCVRRKNQILIRWRDEKFRDRRKEIRYQPTLYVPTNDAAAGFRTIDGQPLAPILTESLYNADEFLDRYKETGVYGHVPFINAFLVDKFKTIPFMKLSMLDVAYLDIETDSSEGYSPSTEATAEVQLIGMRRQGHTTSYGTKDYVSTRSDVTYRQFDNESDLLVAFLEDWTTHYPDIVTGWNVLGYDMTYLYNRVKNVFDGEVAASLSPWGLIREQHIRVGIREDTMLDIVGVPVLDYFQLYRKFNQNQQTSYTLNHIAKMELGIEKVKFDDEYETLARLYAENFPLFVDYNLTDVDLVEKLEAKLGMLQMVVTMAHTAHVNFMDTFKQVRMWDIMIYRHLLDQHIIVPPKQPADKGDSKFEGAWVKTPESGKTNWVVSYDVASLYPSLMRQWSISPDTFISAQEVERRAQGDPEWALVKTLQETINVDKAIDWMDDPAMVESLTVLGRLGVTITPNKQVFDTTRPGFMGEMLAGLYESRASWKREQLKHEKLAERATTPADKEAAKTAARIAFVMQSVAKVGLNSCYGGTGNPHYRFFDTRLAEAVTLSGQAVTRLVECRINRAMNKWLKTKDIDYVIAGDTDSVYLNMGPVVAKIPPTDDMATAVDAFSKKWIEPILDKIFKELHRVYHGHANVLSMKRELIADAGIWMKKKHYVLNVLDSEGVRYQKPKLKIKGLQIVRSSTPPLARQALQTAYELILRKTEQDLWTFVAKTEREFQQASFDQIAFATGVKSLDGFMTHPKNPDAKPKRVFPAQVKAARSYNQLLVDLHLSLLPIRPGDKIRWTYLKPNIHGIETIAAPRRLPPEFQLDQHIDRVVVLEKAFLGPLTEVLEELHWNIRETTTLEDFFS